MLPLWNKSYHNSPSFQYLLFNKIIVIIINHVYINLYSRWTTAHQQVGYLKVCIVCYKVGFTALTLHKRRATIVA